MGIARDKMFIIASNIDDSIKSVTPVYDISIFPNFIKFEEYINTTPIVLGSIIISERELPFTSSNMSRILDVLSAPFLKLTGSCIYLISENTPKDMVTDFLEDNGITTIVAYQGDKSLRSSPSYLNSEINPIKLSSSTRPNTLITLSPDNIEETFSFTSSSLLGLPHSNEHNLT